MKDKTIDSLDDCHRHHFVASIMDYQNMTVSISTIVLIKDGWTNSSRKGIVSN